MKIVYKKFKIWNDQLVSWFIAPPARLIYRPHRITRPKFGMIFAFDDRDTAINYEGRGGMSQQVWICECGNSYKARFRASVWQSWLEQDHYINPAHLKDYKKFWVSRSWNKRRQGIYMEYTHSHTVVCDWIKLMEQIA